MNMGFPGFILYGLSERLCWVSGTLKLTLVCDLSLIQPVLPNPFLFYCIVHVVFMKKCCLQPLSFYKISLTLCFFHSVSFLCFEVFYSLLCSEVELVRGIECVYETSSVTLSALEKAAKSPKTWHLTALACLVIPEKIVIILLMDLVPGSQVYLQTPFELLLGS